MHRTENRELLTTSPRCRDAPSARAQSAAPRRRTDAASCFLVAGCSGRHCTAWSMSAGNGYADVFLPSSPFLPLRYGRSRRTARVGWSASWQTCLCLSHRRPREVDGMMCEYRALPHTKRSMCSASRLYSLNSAGVRGGRAAGSGSDVSAAESVVLPFSSAATGSGRSAGAGAGAAKLDDMTERRLPSTGAG